MFSQWNAWDSPSKLRARNSAPVPGQMSSISSRYGPALRSRRLCQVLVSVVCVVLKTWRFGEDRRRDRFDAAKGRFLGLHWDLGDFRRPYRRRKDSRG